MTEEERIYSGDFFMSKESDEAIEAIIAYLEDLEDGKTSAKQEKLPVLERLKVCWDLLESLR